MTNINFNQPNLMVSVRFFHHNIMFKGLQSKSQVAIRLLERSYKKDLFQAKCSLEKLSYNGVIKELHEVLPLSVVLFNFLDEYVELYQKQFPKDKEVRKDIFNIMVTTLLAKDSFFLTNNWEKNKEKIQHLLDTFYEKLLEKNIKAPFLKEKFDCLFNIVSKRNLFQIDLRSIYDEKLHCKNWNAISYGQLEYLQFKIRFSSVAQSYRVFARVIYKCFLAFLNLIEKKLPIYQEESSINEQIKRIFEYLPNEKKPLLLYEDLKKWFEDQKMTKVLYDLLSIDITDIKKVTCKQLNEVASELDAKFESKMNVHKNILKLKHTKKYLDAVDALENLALYLALNLRRLRKLLEDICIHRCAIDKIFGKNEKTKREYLELQHPLTHSSLILMPDLKFTKTSIVEEETISPKSKKTIRRRRPRGKKRRGGKKTITNVDENTLERQVETLPPSPKFSLNLPPKREMSLFDRLEGLSLRCLFFNEEMSQEKRLNLLQTWWYLDRIKTFNKFFEEGFVAFHPDQYLCMLTLCTGLASSAIEQSLSIKGNSEFFKTHNLKYLYQKTMSSKHNPEIINLLHHASWWVRFFIEELRDWNSFTSFQQKDIEVPKLLNKIVNICKKPHEFDKETIRGEIHEITKNTINLLDCEILPKQKGVVEVKPSPKLDKKGMIFIDKAILDPLKNDFLDLTSKNLVRVGQRANDKLHQILAQVNMLGVCLENMSFSQENSDFCLWIVHSIQLLQRIISETLSVIRILKTGLFDNNHELKDLAESVGLEINEITEAYENLSLLARYPAKYRANGLGAKIVQRAFLMSLKDSIGLHKVTLPTFFDEYDEDDIMPGKMLKDFSQFLMMSIQAFREKIKPMLDRYT